MTFLNSIKLASLLLEENYCNMEVSLAMEV